MIISFSMPGKKEIKAYCRKFSRPQKAPLLSPLCFSGRLICDKKKFMNVNIMEIEGTWDLGYVLDWPVAPLLILDPLFF